MIIRDESILAGMSDSASIGRKGQFIDSVGIDPEMPSKDTTGVNDYISSMRRPFGGIRPVKFNSVYINSLGNEEVMWMVKNPKNSDLYLASRDGPVCILTNTFSSSSPAVASTGGRGYGMAYYNNNLLIAKPYEVARYSYLDEPSADRRYDETFWGTELGFDPMEFTEYPELHGVPMPNHMIHRHVPKNAAYVCDVQDGSGVLHKIRLKYGTDSFDTDDYEGAVDDDSEFIALDFGKGLYPTCIESMGSYLIIGLIEMGEDGAGEPVWEQKPGKLIMWDTSSDTFQDITPDDFSDPLITALKNVNGTIYVFSGATTGGCRVSQFLGVEKLKQLHYISNAYPPLAGAVDKLMNRVTFGTGLVTSTGGVLGVGYSIGSITPSFNMGLHGTIAPDFIASKAITSLRYYEEGQLRNQPVISEADSFGNCQVAIYEDAVVDDITVRVHLDDASKKVTIYEIGYALFPDERTIEIFPDDAIGDVNFFIEIRFGNNCIWKSSMKQIAGPFELQSIVLTFANKIEDGGFIPAINLPITYKVVKRNV